MGNNTDRRIRVKRTVRIKALQDAGPNMKFKKIISHSVTRISHFAGWGMQNRKTKKALFNMLYTPHSTFSGIQVADSHKPID